MSHGGTLKFKKFRVDMADCYIPRDAISTNHIAPPQTHSIEPYGFFDGYFFCCNTEKGVQKTLFIFRFFSNFSFFSEKARSDKTRGHTLKLKTVSEWNALPDDAVSSATLNQFKNRLERHMKAVAVCG